MKIRKKIKYKDLDKIDLRIYLNYFGDYARRLVDNANGKEMLTKFVKSLTNEEGQILGIIKWFPFVEDEEGYKVLEEEILLNTLSQIKNKHPQIYNKIRNNLSKQNIYFRWLEIKKIIEAEIETLPKDKLLFIFAKFFSAVADWQSRQDLIQMIKIRNSWLQEIKELSLKPEFKNIKRKDAKTKKAYIIELIKILAGKNLEEYKSDYLEGIKKMEKLGFYERRFPLDVNLDEELDLEKLNYDRNRYWIETRKMHYEKFNNIVEDGYKRIHIKDENGWRDLSLSEYYEENIDKLSPEILRSKDLLDQIFVVYVIKRVQNGDGKARNKLFECYIKKAGVEAIKFIIKKQRDLGLRFNLGGELDKDSIKSVAGNLLWTLLGGDLLEKLPLFLKNEQPVETQLTRRIDRKILEMYNSRFLQLEFEIRYYLSEWKKFKKKIKNLKYNLKKSVIKDKKDSIAYYLSKICEVGLRHLHFFDTNFLLFSFSFDPYIMLSSSPKFNRFLFIPKKNSNLTTWLFGDWKGMFWQKLNDWYKSITHMENGKRLVKKEDLAPPEGIISHTKWGKRRSQSKEEFLANYEDIRSLEELKELEE